MEKEVKGDERRKLGNGDDSFCGVLLMKWNQVSNKRNRRASQRTKKKAQYYLANSIETARLFSFRRGKTRALNEVCDCCQSYPQCDVLSHTTDISDEFACSVNNGLRGK